MDEWTPVSHGDPLRDATLYYAPPSLERVRIDQREASAARHRSRSHARSGDAVFQQQQPLVIAAEPIRDEKKESYSIYGTPGINYSEYYTNPPKKGRTSKKKKESR